MSQEGKQKKEQFRNVARYDAEMAEHYMNLVEAGNIMPPKNDSTLTIRLPKSNLQMMIYLQFHD